MIFYAILILAVALVLFGALKVFASQADKAKTRTNKTSGVAYKTAASDIHKFVEGAHDWMPHLKHMQLFWIACIFTGILICLDYYFGYMKAGLAGAAVIGTFIAAADIAIPFVALEGDIKGKRSVANQTMLVLFTIFTVVVIIGSTAEVATVSRAKSDIAVLNYSDTLKVIKQKQDERDAIKIDRGAEALEGLAKSADEAAAREGNRTKCGQLCEKLKAEAADYHARAKDQARKESLTAEIEALKLKMSGGGQDNKMDSDAMASNIEGLSGGIIPRDVTRRYGLTTLGIVLVITITILWTQIGSTLAEEIKDELTHRGEIADEMRANLGLPPRYTVAAPATALLAAPDGRTNASGDGITINVAAADMRKRYANDEQLLETDGLFDTLLLNGEGGSVTIAAMYRAYQIAKLTGDPNSRYMTLPTMAAKLMIIAQNRDDVRVTADGIIEGWVLKPAAGRKLEVVANA